MQYYWVLLTLCLVAKLWKTLFAKDHKIRWFKRTEKSMIHVMDILPFIKFKCVRKSWELPLFIYTIGGNDLSWSFCLPIIFPQKMRPLPHAVIICNLTKSPFQLFLIDNKNVSEASLHSVFVYQCRFLQCNIFCSEHLQQTLKTWCF